MFSGTSKKLFEAASEGDLETVQKMVAKGANIEYRSGGTYKPCALIEAAFKGRIEVVKFLVESGADIEAEDSVHDTPLMEALRGEREAVAVYLIEQGANPSHKNK